MTTKEQVWLIEYLKCWNATEAARRADYKWPNKVGSQLKTRFAADIAAEIDEKKMSADEVLTRTADIARGDLAAYITVYGELDIEQLKADGLGHLLKKYKRTRRTFTRKDGEEIETETLEAELYAADVAHDKIMRVHGLYNDKVDMTSGGQPLPVVTSIVIEKPKETNE